MPEQSQCFMCGSPLPFAESECLRCADSFAAIGVPGTEALAPAVVVPAYMVPAYMVPAEVVPASVADGGFHLMEDDFVIAEPGSEPRAHDEAVPASATDFGFHLVDDGFVEEAKPVYKSQLKRVDPARLRTRLVVEDEDDSDPYAGETDRADAHTPASYTYPEIYGPPQPPDEQDDAQALDPAPADSASTNHASTDHAAVPSHAAALISVRIGPGFNQLDANMDGRHSTWTDTQKSDYLLSVIGTQVKWQGEVIEVNEENGGRVTLKCNPETRGSDTVVELDGAQVDRLVRLCKHQRISVVGILSGHDESGYAIVDARVLNI